MSVNNSGIFNSLAGRVLGFGALGVAGALFPPIALGVPPLYALLGGCMFGVVYDGFDKTGSKVTQAAIKTEEVVKILHQDAEVVGGELKNAAKIARKDANAVGRALQSNLTAVGKETRNIVHLIIPNCIMFVSFGALIILDYKLTDKLENCKYFNYDSDLQRWICLQNAAAHLVVTGLEIFSIATPVLFAFRHLKKQYFETDTAKEDFKASRVLIIAQSPSNIQDPPKVADYQLQLTHEIKSDGQTVSKEGGLDNSMIKPQDSALHKKIRAYLVSGEYDPQKFMDFLNS